MAGPAPGTVRLWRLAKRDRTATCDAHAHALGLEVVATVADDIMRIEVARRPDAAQQVADEWRQMFEAKGWLNA